MGTLDDAIGFSVDISAVRHFLWNVGYVKHGRKYT